MYVINETVVMTWVNKWTDCRWATETVCSHMMAWPEYRDRSLHANMHKEGRVALQTCPADAGRKPLAAAEIMR